MDEHNKPVQEKSTKKLFIDEIERRHISKLVHFTTNLNLCSIFKEKFILPRDVLEGSEDPNLYNSDFMDSYRFDGKDHINCSIEKINSRMFEIKRNNLKGEEHCFCILAIEPKYLYRETTRLSVANAANSYNRNVIGIDGTFEKFLAMFSDTVSYRTSYCSNKVSRSADTGDNVPTDIQAEVLIYDPIAVEDLIAIYFEDELKMKITKSILELECPEYDLAILKFAPELFKTR